MKTTNKRTRPAWMLALLACVALLAGVAAGCTPAATSTDKAATTDTKPMLEAVAKWYVAQGALDMPGFKAGIYDPEDILGVATMTAAPEGAEKSEVKWEWAGETIVVTVPSEQSTITLTASPEQANVVLLKDAMGQDGTFVMKNDNGVWKIDVAETQKVSEAQGAAPQETTGSAPATEAP